MANFQNYICQIWMGSLESYMNENFIMNAFKHFGENPTHIKIMRDKLTGDLSGYCFVHFEQEDTARMALHKLNGKTIPNSSPPARFKLNYAGTSNRHGIQTETEYSLFVGDLPLHIDDYTLYKCFAGRYRSLRSAKVVFDSKGVSKGYAFVRFSSEADMKSCTREMQGYAGLGGKPMKIGPACPRNGSWKKDSDYSPQNSSNTSTDASNAMASTGYPFAQPYYNPAAWQQYAWQSSYYQQMLYNAGQSSFEGGNDEMALIDHASGSNIDEMNKAVISRDIDFWDSIENSKWSPLDALQAQA